MLQRAIGMPGTLELLIIFGAVLIIFGPKKIPELAKGIGKGLREFRKASNEVGQAIHEASVEEIDAPKGSVTPEPATHDAPSEVPVERTDET